MITLKSIVVTALAVIGAIVVLRFVLGVVAALVLGVITYKVINTADRTNFSGPIIEGEIVA